jgi:signal transduction histidine kinase/ActR/RegA family two-component response regulator
MHEALKRWVDVERERLEQSEPAVSSKPGAAAVTASWRANVGHADEYMSLFDLDLRITFMNRLQPGVPDVVGLPVLSCIEPAKHELFLQATAAAYVTGLPHYYETQGTGPGGEPVAYRSWVVPLAAHDKKAAFASVSVDITDLGRVQRELAERASEHRALEAQLAQAQKMQALGQLTGGIAHDFNNLLTVIIGSLALLKNGSSSPERARELAQQADSAASRAAALTQRLLAFSRRQPLRPTTIDPRALLTGMEQLLHRTLPADIALRVEVHAETWLCMADPVQLESAVLNLAINARDAMPKGGSLRVGASNARVEPKSTLEQERLQPGDYVLIEVSDTGTGMSADVLHQAFEPFFTTKDVGQGSGLGLSMVYGFAEQSGGQAKLVSELGRGTTVQLYLPRSARSISTTNLAAVSIPLDGGGKRVLVVEDDAAVRDVVCEMLGRAGYQTIAASDGPSAQRLLASTQDIALLLVDMMLPGGMSGAELVSAVRREQSALPVLFMTGYSKDALSDAPEIHGTRLLSKPFTEAALTEAVHEALHGEPLDAL